MSYFGDINIWSCWLKFCTQPFLEWRFDVYPLLQCCVNAPMPRQQDTFDPPFCWTAILHGQSRGISFRYFSVDQPSSFVSDIGATELKYGFMTNIQTTEWYWYTTSCNMYFWVLVTFSASALTFRTPQSTMSCQWGTMKTTWTGDTYNPPHIKFCIHVPEFESQS